jgi:outer membrane protein OmpA-like peptidoglycan-associated protein
MMNSAHTLTVRIFIFTLLLNSNLLQAQVNLLLNGGFEDVNTCTEYNSPCGVEGWFYLKDVKAQMLENENALPVLGNNSFGIFYNWAGYTEFIPVIGTILPCGLQAGNRYIFKGIIAAKLNPALKLKPGLCLGEKFYVPRRPFTKEMHPDSIIQIQPIPQSNFFTFEYSFIATGNEKYLTFGTYIGEDTSGSRKKLFGTQTISIVLDNFELIPENKNEIICPDFMANRKKIYDYNYRHKEMDYSLFGKGELAINMNQTERKYFTQYMEQSPETVKPDTFLLGDVFFDYNKAALKPSAEKMLKDFFIIKTGVTYIDSMFIEGHTDSIGSDSSNIVLSTERCKSIRQWLIANNISTGEQIRIHPYGESRPLTTNSTPEGRALNRRVEIIVFRKNEMPQQ